MFLCFGSRRDELPYPEANVGNKLAQTSSDLQKHLSPMKDDLTGNLVQSPSHGFNLVSTS